MSGKHLVSVSPGSVFAVASPKVLSDTNGAETLVINLDTGLYYSFEDAASLIWQGLLRGNSVQQILSRLQTEFAADELQLTADCAAFVGELLAEHLLVAAQSAGLPSGAGPTSAEERTASGRPYQRPAVKKFHDLQALLLADPIHELPSSAESSEADRVIAGDSDKSET